MFYDRRHIMKKAHARVRAMMAVPLYRAAGYRALFSGALKRAWSEATADRREAVRLSQNTGLPIRSCPADALVFRPRVQADPAQPRVIRFGSLRLFVGPGAHSAAIAAAADRVGARFQNSRNQGRRASEWA